MEAIASFWGNLVSFFENSDVLSSLAGAAWIDWIAVFGVFLGFIWGVKQGIMRMIVEIAELMLVIFLVMLVYKNLAGFLSNILGSGAYKVAEPIAFFLTTAIVFLAVAFIDSFLKKLMHTEVVAPLRILGGAILGMIHSILLLGLLTQAVLTWPFWGTKKVFEPGNSKFGSALRVVVPVVFDLMTDPDVAFDRFKKDKKKKPAVEKKAETLAGKEAEAA